MVAQARSNAARSGLSQEALIRADLKRARDAGYAVLASGGEALDAVTTVITMLEDSPHFNAGKGAVFTAEGTNELDASIMDGSNLRAGAVAGLTRIKNPILLARSVMERSPHVMMVGVGAEIFAREVGMEFVIPDYFRTEARWKQYLDAKAAAARPRAMLPVRRTRSQRPPCCGNLNWRHDTQTLRPRRRCTHHRCGHLRRRSLRRVGDWLGRILHPPECCARYLRTRALCRAKY